MNKEYKSLYDFISSAYCKCLISQSDFNNLIKDLDALNEAKTILDSRKMKPKFLVGEEVFAIEYKNALEPVVTKILIESTDWYTEKKQFHYNYKWYEKDLFRSLDECKTELIKKADELHVFMHDMIDGIIKYFNEKEGDK